MWPICDVGTLPNCFSVRNALLHEIFLSGKEGGLPPLRLDRGLEEVGKQRKEFTVSEGPLRAKRAGASESLD
jgi:hypothetical protein